MNQTFLELIAPKHLLTFLGEKGLTSSEADHRANLIKEGHTPLVARWNSTGAISKTVNYKGEQVVLSEFRKIDLIADSMVEGQMNSLSAWLREGIKAKDAIANLVMSANLDNFVSDEDPLIPTQLPVTPVQKPVRLKVVSEDDVLGGFTIAERAEYYTLQSMAASIGKRIHNGGEISNMRKELAVFKSKEFLQMQDGNGYNNFVVTNVPVYEPSELETAFMDLQEKHRAAESRLNFLKANIKNEVNLQNQANQQEYSTATMKNQEVYRKEYSDYQAAFQEIRNAQIAAQAVLEKRRLELTRYVSKLRIVIPNSLQPILDTIVVPKEVK